MRTYVCQMMSCESAGKPEHPKIRSLIWRGQTPMQQVTGVERVSICSSSTRSEKTCVVPRSRADGDGAGRRGKKGKTTPARAPPPCPGCLLGPVTHSSDNGFATSCLKRYSASSRSQLNELPVCARSIVRAREGSGSLPSSALPVHLLRR